MSEQATGRQMTITRVFDAPRELVWQAFTQPEELAAWFGTPPYKTPPETVSMDVRPGGKWTATMVSEEDGSKLPFAGRYREVEEPQRLVFTFDDVNDPTNENVEVATVTFADLDGKTEVTLTQAGHMPEEEYGRLEEGYSVFFDRLAEHLAKGDN